MLPQNSKGSRKNRLWALLFLGAGLMIAGIAAAVWLVGYSADSQGSTFTVSPMAVEYPAPELKLRGLDGDEHSLVDYRGKVVLVNNWATWCPPCKAEMPTLQSYFDEHQAEGFTLIAIEAGDTEADVRQFVEDYELTFPVWLDRGLRALVAFRNEALPSSYVIDRDGIIRLAWTGPISEKMLEKFITPMLEE